jgi:hypothetical protein
MPRTLCAIIYYVFRGENMKVESVTDFSPTGPVLYEEGIDPERLTFSKRLFTLFPVVIFVVVFIFTLGDFGGALLAGVVSALPSIIGLTVNLSEAKKFYFRIRSDGVEFGSPERNAFIPYSEIIWFGETPKPFAKRDEVGFAVDNIDIMSNGRVVISPFSKTWTLAYKSKNEISGLIIYPTESFSSQLKIAIENCSDAGIKS